MSARLHNCPTCGPVIQHDQDSICCPRCGEPAERYRPMTESERREAYERAAAHLPKVDLHGWVWTAAETDILRKACATRFDETLRTESLFAIAAAALRIAAGRAAAS